MKIFLFCYLYLVNTHLPLLNKKKKLNNQIKCRVCDSNTYYYDHSIIYNQNIKVLKCSKCNLVQLSTTNHISDDFYESSEYFGDNLEEILTKEKEWNLKRVKLIKENLFLHQEKVGLDFGCGPGGFLDVGSNIFKKLYGYDLSERIREWNKSKKNLILDNLDNLENLGNIDTVMLFHVLEHIKKPLEFIEDIKGKFTNLETLIIEVPNNDEMLISEFNNEAYKNNHYSTEHLNYFNYQTIVELIKSLSFRILFKTQYQRYQLGNTLGWLNYGKGGYQNYFTEFNNYSFHEFYEKALLKREVADTIFVIASIK